MKGICPICSDCGLCLVQIQQVTVPTATVQTSGMRAYIWHEAKEQIRTNMHTHMSRSPLFLTIPHMRHHIKHLALV